MKELIDGYKLYYTEQNNAMNGVGIVADNDMKQNIVGVHQCQRKNVIPIISAYAPRAGLDESVKGQLREEMDGLM